VRLPEEGDPSFDWQVAERATPNKGLELTASSSSSGPALDGEAASAPGEGSARMTKPRVARIWQGRTPDSTAEEYAEYLYEEGVKKLRSTKGNLGVQVLRQMRHGEATFMTISYWGSRDEIRAYAGDDIEKTHHLPKDAEYLLELPPYVQHFDIIVNEWGSAVSSAKGKAAGHRKVGKSARAARQKKAVRRTRRSGR
jgi:heme-degrading monooxygenase HmoA